MTQGEIMAGPGWYPDPEMANTLRYWDGKTWTNHVAPGSDTPTEPPATRQPAKQPQVITALVIVVGVIGFIMSMQSASLLTGTGSLWTGAALACGAAIGARLLTQSTPRWARIVAAVLAAIAVANVTYVETQLQEKRQQVSNLLK